MRISAVDDAIARREVREQLLDDFLVDCLSGLHHDEYFARGLKRDLFPL